jgi:hypothetical protein
VLVDAARGRCWAVGGVDGASLEQSEHLAVRGKQRTFLLRSSPLSSSLESFAMSLMFNLDEVNLPSAFSDVSADLPRLQEVRLTTNNADRERIEELANLYSLIVSLNYLERAYVRDSITASQCVSLLPFSV